MSTPPAPSHSFGPYRLRPAHPGDRALLEQWIENDPDHRDRLTPDFFLEAAEGEDVWAVELDGYTVFFLKTQVACRLHTQFGPSEFPDDRERNRDALLQGIEWLTGQLRRNGFREVLFSSVFPPLIATAVRRMGFRRSPHELIRAIPAWTPNETLLRDALREPQTAGQGRG